MPNEENLEGQTESLENLEGQEDQESLEETSQEHLDGPASEEPEELPPDPEFTHPALAGKSPAEIEEMFRLAENTVREMRSQIDASHRTREPEPEPEVQDPNEFFANPYEAIRKEMDRTLEPFKEDLRLRRAQTVREKLRSEIPDFGAHELRIDQILAQNNFPNPDDEGLLRSLYFMAKGMAASEQKREDQPVSKSREPRRSPAPAPPQHRPSSTPLPESRTKDKPPPLTESEKLMMRQWGMNEEEWRAYQNAEADQVLHVDVGGSND